MNEQQFARLNEVYEHQAAFKNMNLSEKQLQTQYLADINVTLALIFDELRMIRTRGIDVPIETFMNSVASAVESENTVSQ